MITKNAKNFIKLTYTHNGLSFSTFPSGTIKKTDGTLLTSHTYSLSNPFRAKANLASGLQTVSGNNGEGGLKLRFGSGTTTATEDDYRIENEISDYKVFTVVTNSSTYSESYNSDYTILSRSITVNMLLRNTGTTDIVISEMGLTYGTQYSYNSTTGSSYYTPILLYREVLSEPITIVPQGVVTITKTITVDIETGYEMFS